MLKLHFCYIVIMCFIGINEGRPEQPHESNTKSLTFEEVKLFEKLINPTDTRLQQDAKLLLAKYLAEQAAIPVPVPSPAPVTQTPIPISEAPVETTTEIITSTSTAAPTTTGTTAKPVTIPAAILASTPRPTVPPSPSQSHILGQVDKILSNVSQGNVVGIVDSALGIRAPAPVRNLVVGILNLIFCSPVDRYLARCASGGSAGATAGSIIGK